MEITLNTFDKIKEFIHLTSRIDADMDLTSGRYVVDAKSIMGIFSLDLSKPMKLEIHGEVKNKKILEELEKFSEKCTVAA